MPAPGSARRTIQCNVCCAPPDPIRRSTNLDSPPCVSLTLCLVGALLEARSPLNRPPSQCLAQPLRHKEPVIPHLARGFTVRLRSVTVVVVVAINQDLMVRINLRRFHLGLL